ncbi:MAG: heat-inducible transcriptional repressor HrcA [Candidatus Dormibacter sp.]|uniref:heat-inducible transcriptional repressor HrcA n=1 Tax=Candidatus Dormibacter sp. TaxID=2973982 RepID=UPI003D9B72DF
MQSRKQDILKAVVREFTVTATPVASQALVSRHFLNLSSATVRSELSGLVDLGYLIQPHTSAGRIPTDRGYRYFVDFLMEAEPAPPAVEAYIEAEFRSTPPDPQSVVEKVATIAASVTRNASVVTGPQGGLVRVKHLDLVSLEPEDVLVVLVAEGNLIRQQVVRVSSPIRQQELTRLSSRFNRELAGRDRDELELRLGRLGEGVEKELLGSLVEALALFESRGGGMVVHDGVRNLLKQPEFAESSRLHEVLEVLEETRYLVALLQELAANADLQIVIGSENRTEQLRSCAVILTTWGPSRRVQGVLGVVGPTRLDYGATVGRLQAIARQAGARLAEAYA